LFDDMYMGTRRQSAKLPRAHWMSPLT